MYNFPSTVRLSKQSLHYLELIYDQDEERIAINNAMGRDCFSYSGVSDIVESALCNFLTVVFDDLEESKARYYDFMNEHCKQCAEAKASDASQNAEHEPHSILYTET